MTDIAASSHLFSQAATLMVVGMGFVFVFLGILIVVIKYLIAPLAKKYPDKSPQETQKALSDKTTKDHSEIVAAITVAISRYRQKHQ
ncbi:MAG: OadG family protein [Alcanivoracaceae bacterium]|nr:OadG family protein [Alcanivoracaceae bacterium]